MLFKVHKIEVTETICGLLSLRDLLPALSRESLRPWAQPYRRSSGWAGACTGAP